MRLLPALFLLAALPLHAADAPQVTGSIQQAPMGAPLPEALQHIQSQGVVIVKSFPAPDGLTGWVVRIEGHYVVIYSTSSGNYLVSGALVDTSGRNLSTLYTDQYVPKPDVSKLVAALAPDPWLVDEGAPTAPLIYVYADPNCIYCNKLWNDLRPYVKSGKVRVRWALLDFLKPTSKGRAAAILSAHDRAAALAQDETRFDKDQEEGGIEELRPVPLDIDNVLTMHTEQMQEAGDMGTPTIIFQGQSGWNMSYGAPKDIAAFIAALTRKTEMH